MKKKVILIIGIFLLMMNLLIGVIYATEDGVASEHGREYYILGAFAIFIVFLVIVAKKASLKILLRVIITMFILSVIYVNGIANKMNIVILTSLVMFLIAFANIFIKEGIHKKSFSELVSVMVTSLIVGITIYVICIITGIKLSYKDEVLDLAELANTRGLIFGMVTIGLLGIYMDIISRITLKLDEEKNKTEDITWKAQFKDGISIGKELISEKVNMLLLIFAGITLLPVCMYVSNGYKIIEILNVNPVFLMCIIAFVGNVGLVLSVIVTSFVYAMFNRKKTIYKTTSDNKIDGKRSLKL